MNIASSNDPASTHIRKLDITRDLDSIADLIELCFPIHEDQDGKTYITQMRKAARDIQAMSWLSAASGFNPSRASGFVWQEDGKIVGNLSLIPVRYKSERRTLIANVAVHPDYRQRGIARALTRHALADLRQHHQHRVWLQVRHDNLAAQSLYRSLGFKERARYTTWTIRPSQLQSNPDDTSSSLKIRPRRKSDWLNYYTWLNITYPASIRWNLSVDFDRFEPGFISAVSNWLERVHLRHWVIELDGAQRGVICWEKTQTYAHHLWLAFEPIFENRLLSQSLMQIAKRLPPRHPISIDYPEGRAQAIFEVLGFSHFRTLIWMSL